MLPDLPSDVQIDTLRVNSKFGKRDVSVLRLDLIHPITGGNKWFKLKENLNSFYNGNFNGILSFGGAFSNHIAALADVGLQAGIRTIGIIRGEETSIHNPTLARAKSAGMELHFITREEYRHLRDPDNWDYLKEQYGQVLILPEGGSNVEGVSGCAGIVSLIPDHFHEIALPVGTGATFAGIYGALRGRSRLWGIKVLEAAQEKAIQHFLKVEIIRSETAVLPAQFTFGGYARKSPELDRFVNEWNATFPVPIETIYTGRLFYGMMQLLREGVFTPDKEILLIHTGGMQYLDH